MMDDKTAIATVRAGGRAMTRTSMDFTAQERATEATCLHRWRTIACDSETDVIECYRCGRQTTCVCDFDEEYD